MTILVFGWTIMGNFEEERMKYCLAKHSLFYLQLQIFTMIFFTAHNIQLQLLYKKWWSWIAIHIYIYHCTASIENNYEPSFHAPLYWITLSIWHDKIMF